MQEVRKIAVLVDGDNAESKLIEQILDEAGKYGKVAIKRVYGDFSIPQISKNWSKELCNSHAIRPMQKYSYTSGKNSTDTELIIDAMDILLSHSVDGFCIVSSDSDYTGLANRIREQGLFVMGIGRNQTPKPFQKACEMFIFTEVLEPQPENKPSEKQSGKTIKSAETAEAKPAEVKDGKQIVFQPIGSLQGIKPIRQQDIDNAFNMSMDDGTGLAIFPRFHDALKRTNPTFDYRNFGFSSLRKFCEKLAPKYTIVLPEDNGTMSLKKSD